MAVRYHGGGGFKGPKVPDMTGFVFDFMRPAGEKPSPEYKEAMGNLETVGRHILACWALYTTGFAVFYTIIS
jgi:hypothetical protein